MKLITTHHHPALTQPRQDRPYRQQCQLLRDQVHENMGDMIRPDELVTQILLIVVEIIDKPCGSDAFQDSINTSRLDELGVIVDPDTVDICDPVGVMVEVA